MKEIWLFRHSIKTGSGNVDLSPEGFELAKHVAATRLKDKKFDQYHVSPLKRTSETMDAFLDGVGIDRTNIQYDIFPPHAAGTTEDGMRIWNGVCHEAEKMGKDMMHAAMTQENEAALYISREGAALFKKWFDGLKDDSCVLVVSHSPLLEIIILGLFDREFPQLQYCEGFRLWAESSSALKIEELRR